MNPPPAAGEGRARGRAPRRGSHPSISVVLILEDDITSFRSRAAPVVEECARASAELVAVRRGPSGEMLTLARAYPGARCIGAPATATREQLREIGLGEASGDIVAFVEDPSVVVPGWIEALRWGKAGAPPAPEAASDDAVSERAAE